MSRLLALLLAALFLVAPSHAQQMLCGKPMEVIAGLAEHSHEGIIAAGVIGDKQGLLVTAAPDGSTWSILIVDHEKACFLAAGKDWKSTEAGK